MSKNKNALEEQIILRVPPNLADQIRQMMQSEKVRGLSFRMDETGRKGIFFHGSKEFPLTLVDLPCVVESQKTLNGKHFYKSADIGQMIVVQEPQDNPLDLQDWQISSGITPPTRNITRRKFRPKSNIPVSEIYDTESDILRITKGGESEDLLELNADEIKELAKKSSISIKGTGNLPKSKRKNTGKSEPSYEQLFEEALGSPSSNVKPARKRPMTKKEKRNASLPSSPTPTSSHTTKPSTPKAVTPKQPTTPQALQDDPRVKELTAKKSSVYAQLEVLNAKHQELLDQVMMETNQMMKERLQNQISESTNLVQEKQREFDGLVQELSSLNR